jgi:hypothetical protein
VLNIVDDFSVGASGLLGANVMLGSIRQLSTTGTATIDAAGVLAFSGGTFTSSALTNDGQMSFIGGSTSIQGDVVLDKNSHVTVLGAGTTASFVDDVLHNGSEIRVLAGTNVEIGAGLSGTGPFTDLGTVRINGQHQPGNSVALVTFGGDVIYRPTATITLEIGGLTRGTGYDALDVAGTLTLDGKLIVSFVNAFEPRQGDAFHLFKWGSVAGAFDTMNLPALRSELQWDTSGLYTTGRLSIVPEPTCAALLFAMFTSLLARGRRSFGNQRSAAAARLPRTVPSSGAEIAGLRTLASSRPAAQDGCIPSRLTPRLKTIAAPDPATGNSNAPTDDLSEIAVVAPPPVWLRPPVRLGPAFLQRTGKTHHDSRATNDLRWMFSNLWTKLAPLCGGCASIRASSQSGICRLTLFALTRMALR